METSFDLPKAEQEPAFTEWIRRTGSINPQESFHVKGRLSFSYLSFSQNASEKSSVVSVNHKI